MKIKVTEDHEFYAKGEHEVDDARGNYLIRTGKAKEVKAKKKDDDEDEKVEHKAKKEKVETHKPASKKEH